MPEKLAFQLQLYVELTNKILAAINRYGRQSEPEHFFNQKY
jgi:hypothetical protein